MFVWKKEANFSSNNNNNNNNATALPWIGIKSDKELTMWQSMKPRIQDKVIVYLIQGPAKRAKEWVDIIQQRSESSVLFYHSFDEDCPWCLFDKSSTSWNMGRNLLLRHALKAIPQADKHVLFYAQIDYDATMKCRKHGRNHSRCMLAMHDILLDIGKRQEKKRDYFIGTGMISPNTNHDPQSTHSLSEWHSCIDTTMWFIAPSYLPLLHPLATHLVDKGWNFGIQAMFDLMVRYFSYGFYKLPHFVYENPAHASYPQDYNVERMRKLTNEILENDWPELGPWQGKENMRHRCQVKNWTSKMLSTTRYVPDAKFVEVAKRRFENWKALGYPSTLPLDLSRLNVSGNKTDNQ